MDIMAIAKRYAFFIVTAAVALVLLIAGGLIVGGLRRGNEEEQAKIKGVADQAHQLLRGSARPDDNWIQRIQTHVSGIENLQSTLVHDVRSRTKEWLNDYKRMVHRQHTDRYDDAGVLITDDAFVASNQFADDYNHHMRLLERAPFAIGLQVHDPAGRDPGGAMDDPFGGADPFRGGAPPRGRGAMAAGDAGLVFWQWQRGLPTEADIVVAATEITVTRGIVEQLNRHYPAVRRLIMLRTHPGERGQATARETNSGNEFLQRARVVPKIELDLSAYAEVARTDGRRAREEIREALREINPVAFHKVGVDLAFEVRTDQIEFVLDALVNQSNLMLSVDETRLQRVVTPFDPSSRETNPGESIVRVYIKGNAYRYLDEVSLARILAAQAPGVRPITPGAGPGYGDDPFVDFGDPFGP